MKPTEPSHPDAERTILGAIIVSNKAIDAVSASLRPSDFTSSDNAQIYRAALALSAAGTAVDLVTLRGAVPGVEIAYLASLVDGLPPVDNVTPWCRMVREASEQRRIAAAASDIARRARAGEAPAALAAAIEELHAAPLRHDSAPQRVKAYAKDALADIEHRELHRGMVGIPTGVERLDKLTGGWRRGDLIIVAARPSVGKTAFALGLARMAPCLFVSLEMSAQKIVSRLIATEASVSNNRIGFGLTETEWVRLAAAFGSVSEAPLWLDTAATRTVDSIVRHARGLPVELIVIDYLQLLSGGGRHENRQAEISHISRSLKAAAKTLGLPIIALSQLSRGIEARKDRRPVLSDLRESGAIEQDADIVLMLYREAMYNRTEDNQTAAELIVAKHRDGATDTVRLHFDPSIATFSDPERTAQ